MSIVFKVLMLLALIAAFFIPGILSFLWAMINAMQIMVHVPLFSVTFPANAQYFYS